MDSIASASKWMRKEEDIFKGLTDLDLMIENMDVLEDTQLHYKHMQHSMGKVIVRVRDQEQTLEIVVGVEDTEKIIKFTRGLEIECLEKEKKLEEEERMERVRTNK
uniref:Uncharacterized protein n=1 Tax=Cucumis melo TaxID=3656 RepID=A0A9I9DH96_CUCME